MKFVKALSLAVSLLIVGKAVASNWIIINVGDVNTIIPNPKVEALDIDGTSTSSGYLEVDLGDTSNTEAFYYQRIEIINGVEVAQGWQCQTGAAVGAAGNRLIDSGTNFSGEYRYEVSACMTGSGCDVDAYESGELVCSSPVSTQIATYIGENSTGTVETAQYSEANHQHVGITSGEFRVSESGAATYDIAIQSPDGVAGVKPQVSLSYNSQSGDGYVGQGWNISGLSSISRCPKTIAQDGFIGGVTGTKSDRLCYNGQRLQPKIKKGTDPLAGLNAKEIDDFYWNATEYVTEIDSFAIFHRVGTSAFAMETKSGEQHLFGDIGTFTNQTDLMGKSFYTTRPTDFYGNGTDFSDARPNQYTWLLKTIKDVKNNYILYNYQTTPEESYIDSIDYTGNTSNSLQPFARIKFNYRDTLKPTAGYRNGQKFTRTKLLNDIDVLVAHGTGSEQNIELYRHYALHYFDSSFVEEKVYLESIEECAGSTSDCNLPLTFEWERPEAIQEGQGESCEIVDDPGSKFFGKQVCKTNTDTPFNLFKWTSQSYSANKANLQFFDISGDGVPDMVYTENDSWKVGLGPTYGVIRTLSDSFTDLAQHARTIDFNGDGVRDILVPWGTSSQKYWAIISYSKISRQYSNYNCTKVTTDQDCASTTSVTKEVNAFSTSTTADGYESNTHIVDINGDTLEDILYIKSDGIDVFLNQNGSSFSSAISVLGTSDFISPDHRIQRLAENSKNNNAHLSNYSAVDFNGDGVTDIMVNMKRPQHECYGKMSTSKYAEWTPLPGRDTQASCEDGFDPDYPVREWRQTWELYWDVFIAKVHDKNNYSYSRLTSIDLNNIRAPRFSDINGDGLVDLFYQRNDNWYYRISNGESFLEERQAFYTAPSQEIYPIATVKNTDPKLDTTRLLQFIDVNRDGRTDILLPNSTNVMWRVLLTQVNPDDPSEVSFIERASMGIRKKDSAVMFGDVNGDGRLDLLMSNNDDDFELFLAEPAGKEEHVIKSFINGFGVETKVTYASMKDSSIYTSDDSPLLHEADPEYAGTDVFAPNGGYFLVSSVASETTDNNFSEVEYNYSGLILHKKGRGNLGFRTLTTIDKDTCTTKTSREEIDNNKLEFITREQTVVAGCISTITEYFQNFPFTGMPKKTTKYLGTLKVSESVNDVNQRVTADSAVFPYIVKTTEWSRGIDNNFALTTITSHTETENSYDDYGNALTTRVTLFDSTGSNVPLDTNNTSIKYQETSTRNEYSLSNELYKRKGRLTSTNVTKALFDGDNTYTSEREASFEYNADQLLAKEISQIDATNNLVKEYAYDDFGNRVVETVTRPGLGSLVTSTQYDTSGRYQKSVSTSAAGSEVQTITYKYNGLNEDVPTRLVTEIKSSVTDGGSSIKYLDSWGTVVGTESYDKDNNSLSGGLKSEQISRYCDQTLCAIAPTAEYFTYSFKPAGGESYVYFDSWGRELSKVVSTMSGNSVVHNTYSTQGLLESTSQPKFTNDTNVAPSSTSNYDRLRRLISVTNANGGVTEFKYEGIRSQTIKKGAIKTSTGFIDETQTKINNFYGKVDQVDDNTGQSISYTYNANGDLLAANVEGRSAVSTVYNDFGQKLSTTDPEKGIWTYSYYPHGKLKTQTDAKNQTTLFDYDNRGRKISRLDPKGVLTCWKYIDEPGVRVNKLKSVSQWSNPASCANVSDTTNLSGSLYAESFNYDGAGRLHKKTTFFEGKTYTNQIFYDDYSRVRFTIYPEQNVSIANQYKNGYLHKLLNVTPGDINNGEILKEVKAVNARGQAVNISYANGVTESLTFNGADGLADKFTISGTGWNNTHEYSFTNFGTLINRDISILNPNNTSRTFNESFDYDSLNRVTQRALAATDFNGYVASNSFDYDDFGNLTTKGSITDFKYKTGTNQLSFVNGKSVATDNNGNITSDGYRSFIYSDFDKPLQITKSDSSNSVDFKYGANRQLVKKSSFVDGKRTDTLYLGNYEQIKDSSNVIEHKFYAANIVISKKSNGIDETSFIHKDHLGSTVAVSNMSSKRVQQFMYDTFGKQYTLYSESSLLNISSLGIDRGYTGHKMLDDFNIIHMNGRIYDPTLGRFLQADPHIQAPENTQNYNRYSYVLNNPMSMTDPSGYFFNKLFKGLNNVLGDFAPFAGMALMVIPGVGQWAAASMWKAAAIGFVTGGITTGSLKGAIIGAISGAAFQGIGKAFKGIAAQNATDKIQGLFNFGGNMLTRGQIVGQITSHALAGGVISTLSGGKFGHGFFSAGFTKGAGGSLLPGGSNLSPGEQFGGAIASVVIGGTASVLSGGKFANGAKTAAYQYLFNQTLKTMVESANKKLHDSAEFGAIVAKAKASFEAAKADPNALATEMAKWSPEVVFAVFQSSPSAGLSKALSVMGYGIDILNSNNFKSLWKMRLRVAYTDQWSAGWIDTDFAIRYQEMMGSKQFKPLYQELMMNKIINSR